MDRRAFLGTLTASVLAAPLIIEAQKAGKVWRIGYLSPAEGHNPVDESFERSMKGLGYIEGQNLRVERRYTGGRADQLAQAATELIKLAPQRSLTRPPPPEHTSHQSATVVRDVQAPGSGPSIRQSHQGGTWR